MYAPNSERFNGEISFAVASWFQEALNPDRKPRNDPIRQSKTRRSKWLTGCSGTTG